MKLLIISFLFFLNSNKCFSQRPKTDTSGFKKEFEKLLSKYGLSSDGYIINVISTNQSGGQTAFVITNNYYGDTLLDSNNCAFEIVDEGVVKILKVYPKKGVWNSPYVVTDSVKSSRDFYNAGIGVISILNGMSITIDGKTYSLSGRGQNGAASRVFPLKIYLSPNDPDQFFLFGDLQFPSKHYLYYRGQVTWVPMDENMIR